MPKQFWLPGGHATELAEHQLSAMGWSLGGNTDWDLAWTLDPPESNVFAAVEKGRWLNHYRGIGALTLKSHLCVTLREAAARATAAGAGSLYDFAPETYLLPAEWDAWERAKTWNPDAIWIQKPAELSRGRGVALVNDPSEIANENLVVQRYIANPHLLDGYKYSLRFYVLIVSLDPLIAYLFDGGFTKFASRPFSLDAADRADRFRHLTNPDVLRDDPQAQTVSGRNTTHRTYRDRLRLDGIDDERLWNRIRRVLAATVGAALPFMRAAERAHHGTGRGQFELLGIDITVDDTLKPWLLECNLSPSLSVEATAATNASREESDIKTRVVRDTLRCVGVHEHDVPPKIAATADEARQQLVRHDQHRGGFERLWPSISALEALAGAELSSLDRALLEDEGNTSWPAVSINGVESIRVGDQTLIVDADRSRVTLLDADESRTWADQRGVEWLQLGWLTPAGVGSTKITDAPALITRGRNRWNRERVYRLHGLRVAISGATAKLEDAIGRALGWWDADHESSIDATIRVTRRSTVADVLAEIHALALRHRQGVVRRPCQIVRDQDRNLLILSPEIDPKAEILPIMFGGSPFGAWIEREGQLSALPMASVIAPRPQLGDVVLELMSDGPGVIRAFNAAAIRQLAVWLASMPMRATREET